MTHLRFALISGVLFFALSSCAASEKEATAPQEVDGYNGLIFGASFKDVIGSLGSAPFNPWSVKQCLDNIATEGCVLSGLDDTTYFDMQAGIPYAPVLSFSKFDKLYSITLRYHREGSVKRDQCLEVYERSMDWVREKFGELDVQKKADGASIKRTTPGGIQHLLGVRDDQFFNGMADRKFAGQRKVWLMGTFLAGDGKPMCNVDVSFDDDSLGSSLNAGRAPN